MDAATPFECCAPPELQGIPGLWVAVQVPARLACPVHSEQAN